MVIDCLEEKVLLTSILPLYHTGKLFKYERSFSIYSLFDLKVCGLVGYPPIGDISHIYLIARVLFVDPTPISTVKAISP